MKKLIAFLAFALMIPIGFAASASESRIGTKATVRQLCYQLWADTNFGWNNKWERAAWVIRGSDGNFQWIEWNFKEGQTLTTWNKQLPQGTIAQIHTKDSLPNPQPSSDDVTTAKINNIAVYTVSGSGIWRVAANGEITKEADKDWYHNIPQVEVRTHIETGKQ